MKHSLLLLCTVLLFAIGSAFAQVPSKSTYRAQDIVPPSNWRAIPNGRVDAKTGVPRALYFLDYGPLSGSPEAMAKTYLRNNSASLKMKSDVSDMKFSGVTESPLGFHVQFQQVYQNVPVYRGNTAVTIDRLTNKVVFYVSDYKLSMRVQETSAAFGPERAFELAVSHLQAAYINKDVMTTQLMINAEQDQPRLSYRVTFPARQPFGDWEVFVDAITGEVFSVFDRTVYHAPAGGNQSKILANGSGYGWTPEPLTQAQVWYGTPGYTDPGGGCVTDPTTPQLDAQRVVLPLRDITLSGGVYKLEGPYVRLIDWDAPTVPIATAASADSFRFNREQSGFEDVMVYYHVDNSQRYIQSLGFTNIQNLPIGADPHGVNCDDNSYFQPSTNQLAWGEGGVDDAEEADVIVHEYGHAIQAGTDPGWGGGESGALGEGFGDYWARSYGRSISSFGWQRVFKWDAGTKADLTGTFWDGRRCDDPRPYPPGGIGGLEIHDAGQLWASVLMEIWGDIGRTVLDKCVLQSHFLLIGTTHTMLDNAAAVIQADRSLFGGAHVAAMVARFGARNFVNPAHYIPQIIHTPLTDTENLAGPYIVTTRILPGVASLNPSQLKVHWGRTGAFTDSVQLVATANPNEYSTSIPGNGLTASYQYYLSASDSSGASVTSPATAPASFYSFRAGLDITPPVVIHASLRDQALIRWPARVRATVTDNIGIDSVWVDFVRKRGSLTGAFYLTLTSNNSYENTFSIPSAQLEIGDSIFYKIVARDRSTSRNITVSPSSGYNKFAIIAARGIVLVVDDDAASATIAEKGIDDRPASALGAGSRLIVRTLNQVGFVVDTVSFATHDTATYTNYDIVVWSAGSKTSGMFADASKRAALANRSKAGGKVWVEGGEVGYVFRKSGTSTDLDPTFRRSVLRDSNWISDVSGSNLVITAATHPIFTTPNIIASPVPFPSSGAYHRDAMRLLPGNIGVKKVAGWSTYSAQGPDTAGMIIYNPLPDPTVGQTVFDLFSFSAITDTTVAQKLIENTAEFLMTRPGGALMDVAPTALNFGPVQIGDSVTLSLRLKNLGTGTLSVTNITNTSPRLTLSPKTFTLAAQETIRVNLKFKPTELANLADTLRFVSNATTSPVVPVNGRGGLPLVSVTPDSFHLTLSATADTTRRQLRIKNSGTDTLTYTLEELTVTTTASMTRSITQQSLYPLGKNVIDSQKGTKTVLGHGGPDAFGYLWKDSDESGGPQFTWTDIRTVGTQVTGWTGTADDGYVIVSLPFAFKFYGINYTSLKIVTNGFLSFDVASEEDAYLNTALPTTDEPNIGLYPWWDDFDLRTAGTVHYYADAANGRFIVQYTDAPHYASTGAGTYTFQAILKTNGDIVYQYLDMQQTLNSATVGIENEGGTIALQTVYNADYMHNNLALLFTRDAVEWLSVSRTTGVIAPHDSQSVEVQFHPASLASGDYRAQLKLTGNIPSAVFIPVFLRSNGPTAVEESQTVPTEFALSQNYPNPFNPTTFIKYALPKASHVTLSVYNILGQEVAKLVDEVKEIGYHQVAFSGANLASGIYLYRIEADRFTSTRKLILLK